MAALPTRPAHKFSVRSIPNTDLYQELKHNFIILLDIGLKDGNYVSDIGPKDSKYVCGVLTETGDATKPYNERQLTQDERDLALQCGFIVNECQVLDNAYDRYESVRKELFPGCQLPEGRTRDRIIRDEINKRYTIHERFNPNIYESFRENMLEWASIEERESESEVNHYLYKTENIIIVTKTSFAAFVQTLELHYQKDETSYKNTYNTIVCRFRVNPLITKRDVMKLIFSGDGTLDLEWNLIQCQVFHFDPIPTVKSVSKS